MLKRPSAILAASPTYLEALHQQFQQDATSLDPSWRAVFALIDDVESATKAPLRHTATTELGRVQLDPIALINSPGLVSFADPVGRGTLLIEHRHVDDDAVREWLQSRAAATRSAPDPQSRVAMLRGILQAEAFEAFVATKYPTKKRFGGEGAETLAPILARILQQACRHGIRQVVIGGVHRGRLNYMTNVLGMPPAELLGYFIGAHPFPQAAETAADIPYHLGLQRTLTIDGAELSVRLLPNPSHLEAVNAVALGAVRGLQDDEADPASVLALILHTDASVIAQGSVAEILQLSGLTGYSTAGSIHIVVNNQIGFTTEPHEARSSRYCTGLFKAVDCAILHVNAADPDGCLIAADDAVEFRQTFGRDAVIDLVCSRRNGHNELDEPRFTQPLQYAAIDSAEPIRIVYQRQLAAEGLAAPASSEAFAVAERARLELAYAEARERLGQAAPPTARSSAAGADVDRHSTGVDSERLIGIIEQLSNRPAGIALDGKLQRLLRQRHEAIDAGIAWPLAEALALGSLAVDGTPVRFSGQDAVRGAFSQRHFALTDVTTGERHFPLDHLDPAQARFVALNSPLSEYAVLGFEYGHSLTRPGCLTIWEAQFGDFANGAQIIFDQFIVSGEEKWQQRSNLVVLLPHGLEGQGPEHSTARIERLLPLCARNNIEIAHPTTPANYFHLLRRQARRPNPKPLIVLTPKSLLRLPAARSPIADFAAASAFRPLLVDGGGQVQRILMCSGKIAYELAEERAARAAEDTLLLRLERLYPLPSAAISKVFADHAEAELVWVQEEPINAGAWHALAPQLEQLARASGNNARRLRCVARPPSPSPAGGFHGQHEAEQRKLVLRAFADQ